MRPELEPPPWDEDHFDMIFDLCVESAEGKDAADIIRRLSALLGRSVDETDLEGDAYVCALHLSTPTVIRVDDITDAELVEMVERSRRDAQHARYFLLLFSAHTKPEFEELVFDHSLSPIDVVRRATKR